MELAAVVFLLLTVVIILFIYLALYPGPEGCYGGTVASMVCACNRNTTEVAISAKTVLILKNPTELARPICSFTG
jgi:hypothetical protein